MRKVFADTFYWVAVLDRRDSYHVGAVAASARLTEVRIFTSEMIFVEVLAMFAGKGAELRAAALGMVDRAIKNPNVTVVPQTSERFHDALALYRERSDKAWSLTDCASFRIMHEHNIAEALTADRHFKQAGFTCLLGAG